MSWGSLVAMGGAPLSPLSSLPKHRFSSPELASSGLECGSGRLKLTVGELGWLQGTMMIVGPVFSFFYFA